MPASAKSELNLDERTFLTAEHVFDKESRTPNPCVVLLSKMWWDNDNNLDRRLVAFHVIIRSLEPMPIRLKEYFLVATPQDMKLHRITLPRCMMFAFGRIASWFSANDIDKSSPARCTVIPPSPSPCCSYPTPQFKGPNAPQGAEP